MHLRDKIKDTNTEKRDKMTDIEKERQTGREAETGGKRDKCSKRKTGTGW